MIWIVVLTATGGLMAALDTLVVSTALPALRQDLGASVGQLETRAAAHAQVSTGTAPAPA